MNGCPNLDELTCRAFHGASELSQIHVPTHSLLILTHELVVSEALSAILNSWLFPMISPLVRIAIFSCCREILSKTQIVKAVLEVAEVQRTKQWTPDETENYQLPKQWQVSTNYPYVLLKSHSYPFPLPELLLGCLLPEHDDNNYPQNIWSFFRLKSTWTYWMTEKPGRLATKVGLLGYI